jgi:hypothetical protein
MSETEVKVDTGSSPESPETQAEPQQEAVNEVEGLKQGIQAERQKRQEAEARANFTEQLLQQANTSQQTQVESDYDPEDYPTNESVRKMIQQEVGAIKTNSLQEQQTQSYREMSKKEDFAKLVANPDSFFNQLKMNNPGILDSFNSQPNAAELAYNYAKSHPEYIKSEISKATQEVTQKIDQNLNKPNTLSGTGGTDAEREDADKISKLSDAEFNKMVQQVKNKPRARE